MSSFPTWQKKTSGMVIALGELKLADIPLDSIVLNPSFAKIEPTVPELCPHAELREHRASVAVIFCCPTERRLPRLSLVNNAIRYVTSQGSNYSIRTEGSHAQYLENQFSSKTRSTLRRKISKLKTMAGEIDIREYRSAAEFDLFHPMARELSRKTYQEKLLDQGLPGSDKFIKEARQLAEQGKMRAYLLFVKGQPVAYLCCPIVGDGVMQYEYVGFDAKYRKWSPGTVLQYYVVERAFAEDDIRIFDFTFGGGVHKKMYATDERLCADIYFFKPTPKNLSILTLSVSSSAIFAGVRTLLDRCNLKSTAKKFLRGLTVRS